MMTFILSTLHVPHLSDIKFAQWNIIFPRQKGLFCFHYEKLIEQDKSFSFYRVFPELPITKKMWARMVYREENGGDRSVEIEIEIIGKAVGKIRREDQ